MIGMCCTASALRPLALVSLLALVGYGGLAEKAGAQSTSGERIRIVLERSEGFGSCPEYRLTLDGDGSVVYEGFAYVRVTGRRESSIPPAEVRALIEEANRIDFFSLRDSYDATERIVEGDAGKTWKIPATLSGLPTASITVAIGEREKTVESYFGAPLSLVAFERKIEEVAGARRYVVGSDQ
jgi:hypothetical protein